MTPQEKLNLAENALSSEDRRRHYLEAAELYVEEARIKRDPSLLQKAEELVSLSQTSQEITTAPSLVKFEDIGGLKDIKGKLVLKVIAPFRHPDVFSFYGKKFGGGILMYGPPGCGKSLLAEATAGEAHLKFFSMKASDIKDKYVGETEKNIAKLWHEARQQPSIIFFDELDAIAVDRNFSLNHEKSAVCQLLTEMDGFGNKQQKILCVGATNEPWNIDLAFRREGRFGSTLFIPPPDGEARYSILKIHTKNKPLAKGVNLKEIAKLTKGFSGADLKNLVEHAVDIPLAESLIKNTKREITQEDFLQAVKAVQPSTEKWMKMAMKKLKANNDHDLVQELMQYNIKQELEDETKS